MKRIYEIKEKINIIKRSITFIIENDFQYYFFIGQLAYFIEHQPKPSIEKCCKAIQLYESKTNNNLLREYIINRFSIYSYGFNENYEIFRKIFSAILIYEPKKTIDDILDGFYLGACYNNLILEKDDDLELKKIICKESLEYLQRENKKLSVDILEAWNILKD